MPPSRDDAAVFTRIFDRHHHAVYAYFLGRLSDPELSRDLLQETFLRVWRRTTRPPPSRPPSPARTSMRSSLSAWPSSTPPSATSPRSSG
jgi:DNA-directed RNA polymerase specialized sigma24 family protein